MNSWYVSHGWAWWVSLHSKGHGAGGDFLFPTDESEKKFRSVGLFLSLSVTLNSLGQNKLRPPREGCGSAWAPRCRNSAVCEYTTDVRACIVIEREENYNDISLKTYCDIHPSGKACVFRLLIFPCTSLTLVRYKQIIFWSFYCLHHTTSSFMHQVQIKTFALLHPLSAAQKLKLFFTEHWTFNFSCQSNYSWQWRKQFYPVT